MESRFVKNNNRRTGDRIKDLSIIIPKIRSEFFVRLYTFVDTNPEVCYEGYEFFIKDKLTELEFSAGLTGFGIGYFCTEQSTVAKEIIELFHNELFKNTYEYKECKLEIQHDFGKTILGYENGNLIEIDIEE